MAERMAIVKCGSARIELFFWEEEDGNHQLRLDCYGWDYANARDGKVSIYLGPGSSRVLAAALARGISTLTTRVLRTIARSREATPAPNSARMPQTTEPATAPSRGDSK